VSNYASSFPYFRPLPCNQTREKQDQEHTTARISVAI